MSARPRGTSVPLPRSLISTQVLAGVVEEGEGVGKVLSLVEREVIHQFSHRQQGPPAGQPGQSSERRLPDPEQRADEASP
jgi:hypothetical protein